MAYKINIRDLALSQLNGACLSKVANTARILQHKYGIVLELRDEHVLDKLVTHVKDLDDPELKILYKALKSEISKHINSPKFCLGDVDSIQIDSQSVDSISESIPQEQT